MRCVGEWVGVGWGGGREGPGKSGINIRLHVVAVGRLAGSAPKNAQGRCRQAPRPPRAPPRAPAKVLCELPAMQSSMAPPPVAASPLLSPASLILAADRMACCRSPPQLNCRAEQKIRCLLAQTVVQAQQVGKRADAADAAQGCAAMPCIVSRQAKLNGCSKMCR